MKYSKVVILAGGYEIRF